MRQFVGLAVLPLAACTLATSDATADSALPSPATCRNEPLTQFAGQPGSKELGERMLRASGARTLRWVGKGTVVTMEFNPDRITVYLDESNRVERASCG